MTDLVEKDRRFVWHPYTQEKTAAPPIVISGAKGVWLFTADGRRILDGVSSWWVNIHGHSHPSLNSALARQAEELEHVIFAGFTHRPAVELAEKLVDILPSGLKRVFYSDNGSTAVEVALKMAFQYRVNRGEKRTTFVALEDAYHGDTFGAMAASDGSAFTEPFKSLLFNVLRVSPKLDEIEQLLKTNGHEIAALIIEPMLQGAGGMKIFSANWLREIRRICTANDVLLIADEVLTGFGRTGKMFACEHAGISPDIICLSKGLTAGYMPLGVTVATNEIYQAFYDDSRLKTFFHGHSFTANPLACAVAIASLELFETEKTLLRVQEIAAKFVEFAQMVAELPCVKEARTIGGVVAIELKSAEGGYLDNAGPLLLREFLKRNILLRPLGNVLYFMPPYVITDEEIEMVFGEMTEVLEMLQNGALENPE
jgi:adenosylmethionine-8-amino-7-oxononanoate aminotransferase